ncbi:hypothetical protein TNCV_3357501 [Trichonephila clavipes]|nr:hypothetical protein TNCV_3357501 [Trichonephila clavipes]
MTVKNPCTCLSGCLKGYIHLGKETSLKYSRRSASGEHWLQVLRTQFTGPRVVSSTGEPTSLPTFVPPGLGPRREEGVVGPREALNQEARCLVCVGGARPGLRMGGSR